MSELSFNEKIKSFSLKTVLSLIDSNPDKNIPIIIDLLEKLDDDNIIRGELQAVKSIIKNKEGNWYSLISSLWTGVDNDVRKKLFENVIINASIIGGKRQEKNRIENECNIPWAILLDPTSACNLKCTGCWAADYGNQLSMNYETLNSIVKQGKELGTFMYIFSGGEPLTRKNDIIKLCEEHNDCGFLAFTNGTLVDEEFSDDMLKVKNLILAFSIEGFEDTTDSRRGIGTYSKVIKSMELLKSKKLPFGFSTCYTSINTEIIGSEAYFDDMIARGAKFGWFFTYMPVGLDAHTDLMANAEQREFMFDQIRKFRSTKPLFTIDFWNDGEYVKGCIAGGRNYLHINANGDIEPCAFIHYSDSNIHERSLLEAYKSPLFQQYFRNQPFNDNHLRPCPLLDNPEKLEHMVLASGAKSTEMLHPEDVRDLCNKCKSASEGWAIKAEEIKNRVKPG
jgi:MoaA/NifB/PqqE/SkfB family radical SAM enzyme